MSGQQQHNEERQRVQLPMVCTCGGDGGEERQRAADETREFVRAKWAEGSENLLPMDLYDPHWLTYLVHSLNWDFEAYIESIHSDMWCGISVASYRPELPSVYVTCDRVEDGLLAAWKYLYEASAGVLPSGADQTEATS